MPGLPDIPSGSDGQSESLPGFPDPADEPLMTDGSTASGEEEGGQPAAEEGELAQQTAGSTMEDGSVSGAPGEEGTESQKTSPSLPGQEEELLSDEMFDEEGEEESEWVVSNQLPDPTELPESQGGTGVQTTRPASGSTEGEDELQRTLGDLDGAIEAQRQDQAERASAAVVSGNQTRAGGVRRNPEDGDANQDQGEVGGTSTAQIPNAKPREGEIKPSELPVRARQTGDDIPDARDDDVIARQLREAAMAETDPELREAIWEELRIYKGSGR